MNRTFIRKLKRTYFAFVFVMVSVTLITLCAAFYAQANEPNETFYTVSGHVESYDGKALAGVKASGVFFKDGEARLTEDQVTNEEGNFTIPEVPEGAYGSVQILPTETGPSGMYTGATFYVNDPILGDTNIGTITLESLVTSVTGKVVDGKGNGIPNMYIEFYNTSSVKSPDPDIRVMTDNEGNFDILDNWVSFGETFYRGLSMHTTYNVVCLSVPTTWPSQNPRNYPNSYAPVEKSFEIKNDASYYIDFLVDQHITNINIFDRDQGETTFFDEFYRMVYRNGVPQAEPSLVGDSKMQIIGDFELSIIQDCILKVKYYVNSVEVVETYEPILIKSSEGWIPGDQIKTQKAHNWDMWLNNNPWEKIYSNYVLKGGEDTNFIDLDVDFVDAAALEFAVNESCVFQNLHFTQTIGNAVYEYDAPGFTQQNLFVGSVLSVDENNFLNIDYKMEESNTLQHTVVAPVAVDGAKFEGWKLFGHNFDEDSIPYYVANTDPLILTLHYDSYVPPTPPDPPVPPDPPNPPEPTPPVPTPDNPGVPGHTSAQTGDLCMDIVCLCAVAALFTVLSLRLHRRRNTN